MEPLALATLAGLTPKDFEVELIDERIDELPEIYETDLVGITIETYTAKRAYSIAKEIRKQGIKVIMGGIHANLMPDEVIKHCDSMLVGGAEGGIWTQMLNDFKENKVVNLPDSPRTEITFLSFFSGCPNRLKANLILLRPKLTDLLNSL